MDTSFRTSSRRSYELPKPDAGLSEWTNRIKAIQRQVEADEDTEQKRLEEEITAARQARLRRSRGGTPSRADSADLSSRELVGMLGNASDASDKDTPKSLAETYHDRETTLRKLMDRNNVYNPDRLGTSSSKPDSVSLASYIGGRATGPRLNRHAPQADAHDSTEYLQPDLSAPHPIFGTGGVAMPGMTAKRDKSPAPLVGSEMSERYRPTSASSLKPSPSSGVKNEAENPPEPTYQEKVGANRRSFTTMTKSPSPAVTQKYTDILDKSTSETTKPLLIKRKSNGSIPKEPLLPSPTKGDGMSTIGVSPSKSTDYLPSSSWKPSQSTPNPVPSYLTTKSSATFPGGSTPKTSVNSYQGVPIKGIPKSRSHDRDSTIPIPTYSLPRNEVSTSNATTPLRRLMERNSVYIPDKVTTDNFGKSVAERAQTTSLATFMGGSGKGIRLNKHAPQVDAHDPTQFIQPDLSAPHPVFGKGGVAMPGMVTRTSVPNPVSEIDSTGLSKPSSTKKAVWPPVSVPSKTEARPVSPQKNGGRARTTSAPRPANYRETQSSEPTSERSRSPAKGTLVGVPLRDRTISTPSVPPSRQSIVTPSLARPIQPVVKNTPSFSPHVPATTASPAFKKPAAQKDLTPSLSRLRGRGFVQNMVKVSSQISHAPSSPSPSPSRPASTTGKKSSVLDRWQPNAQPESPTKPTSPLLSKNSTTGVSTSSAGTLYDLKSSASFSSLTKPAPISSSPPKQLEDSYPRSRTPGLGSATTMVVIKPSKSFTDLAELGMKTATDSKSSSSRKTPIYMTRAKSQKAIDSFGTPSIDPQVLTYCPPKEHFEEDIVPQSAPAWMGTFILSAGSRKVNASTTQTLPLEVEVMKSPTPCVPVVSGPSRHLEESSAPEITDAHTPRESIAMPFKLSRPNAGNRPSAMEVAQALREIPEEQEEETLDAAIPDPTSPTVSLPKYRGPLSQCQTEKRKSTYEKYAAMTLPPLLEETTPTASPAGTLKVAPELHGAPETEGKSAIPLDVNSPGAVSQGGPSKDSNPGMLSNEKEDVDSFFRLNDDQVADLLKPRPPPIQPVDDVQTISVELLSIVGNAATVIPESGGIFYDSEILAIVHRVKSKASGLASTSVWCWLGKQTRLGDREDKKLQELSGRYGTRAKIVHQLAEPPELVQTLGGRLAIRQGSRRHWTSENTTMHLVRSCRGVILIDEHDFSIKNMCSAFSYCFSLLGSIYVWHGCGSTPKEREGSVEYAHMLSPHPVTPIELFEGGDDADEVFWMMLGDDEFAKADYWRWRHSWLDYDPRIWKVDTSNASNPVVPVMFISMEQRIQTSVFVVDCIWELFVLIGKDGRTRRACICCALDLAKRISLEAESARPYRPTVHILGLPSRLPIDLRLGIRDLDEAWLNDGEVPDYMNLIPCPSTGDIDRVETFSSEL